jgi:hypothetical protein
MNCKFGTILGRLVLLGIGGMRVGIAILMGIIV